MKITFQIPEILLVGSLIFLLDEKATIGWVLFGLFFFGAFARYAIEVQQAKELADRQEQLIKSGAEAISGMFVSSFSNRHSKTIN